MISRLSPLAHAHLLPLTSQNNALCINLWILLVNTLVRPPRRVDERACGNVDNRGDAKSCQVQGLATDFEGRAPGLRSVVGPVITYNPYPPDDVQAGWCFTLTQHRTGCSVAATGLLERSRSRPDADGWSFAVASRDRRPVSTVSRPPGW